MNSFIYRHFPPFLPPLKEGFSLVEVMMALAISSLGFVTMLGLLPHGLQMARSSAELSAESRIKQKLAGELQTSSWDDLAWTGFGPHRYFNDQGIELTEREIQGARDGSLPLAYVASVQLPEVPLDFRLPVGDQGASAERFLRRVKICIVTSADPQFDFGAAPSRRVRSYTAILAETGR